MAHRQRAYHRSLSPELRVADTVETVVPTVAYRTAGREAVADSVEVIAPKIIEVGTAERQVHGQDAHFYDEELGIFGVFDGAGGERNPKWAAATAAKFTKKFLSEELQLVADRSSQDTPEQVALMMRDAILQAQKALELGEDFKPGYDGERPSGITTATIGHVFKFEGRTYLAWASVGDSGILTYDHAKKWTSRLSKDETVQQLLIDQGVTERASERSAKVITNAVGISGGKPALHGVQQFGFVELHDDTSIYLATDGIFGDLTDEKVRDEQIGEVIADKQKPQAIAEALERISLKRSDDATSVAVRIAR